MPVSIDRLIFCSWLASALVGCAASHRVLIDETSAQNQPIPRTGGETQTLNHHAPSPDDAQAQEKLSEAEAALSAVRPADETADDTRNKNIGERQAWAPGAANEADDELLDMWRRGMDKAMEQPPARRRLQLPWPVQNHHRVRHFVENFSSSQRAFFERALARSGRYIPLMASILRDEGLPESLVYLALIESGFSPHAYSRARAVGPWQFMRGTALRYGLKIDPWVDERRDPVLSTRAAAAYLKDLHDTFGEWFLAAAAYNAGEGRLGRALQRSKANDFWELTRHKKHLNHETRNYVPKFIAAAIIAGSPAQYGFRDLVYEAPWEYDEVTIDRPLKLQTIARLARTDVNAIKELNPALLKNFTPPAENGFLLRLPAGSGESFSSAYEKLPASTRFTVTLHKVKRGETLSLIAKRYGQNARRIAKENRLKNDRLRTGQELVIVREQTRKKH